MIKAYSRSIAVAAAAIAGLGVSVSCFAKPVVITYWEPWAGVYRNVNKLVIDQFNKDYAGRIEVKMTQVPDVEEKILTSIVGGVAPDLFKLDRFKVGSYAAKAVLEPLDAYIKKDRVSQDLFFGAPWSENIFNGKTYGMPWSTDARGMWYNKTMFKQIGIDPESPPKTWEEASLVSRKIDLNQGGKWSRVGLIPSGGNWFFLGWLWAAGGEMTTNGGRKAAWNSDAGVKAATFMTDAVAKYGGYGEVARIANDLLTGKLGMMMEGSFWLGWIKDNKAGNKFDIGVANPPRPKGLEKEPLTWSGGYSLAIPKGAKHPKEAWEFIKYYTMTKAYQIEMGRQSGQIPVLKSAAYDERFTGSHPALKTFVNMLPYSRFRTVLPCGQQMWSIYNDELMDTLVKGKKSPADALNSAASEAQKILDRTWARVRVK